jgi:hypothetical protein
MPLQPRRSLTNQGAAAPGNKSLFASFSSEKEESFFSFHKPPSFFVRGEQAR